MMSVHSLVKAHLPTFCFQTAFEVTTMLEGASDSEVLLPNHVGVVLCKLVRDGRVEKRKARMPPNYRGSRGRAPWAEYRLI